MQTCVEKEKLDQSEDMAMVPALPIPGGAIARMQTCLLYTSRMRTSAVCYTRIIS